MAGVAVPGKAAVERARQRRAGHYEQAAASRRNEQQHVVRMDRSECRKSLKALERVKGIEPSYSAWKAANFLCAFNAHSGRQDTRTAVGQRVPRSRSCCTAPSWAKHRRYFRRTPEAFWIRAIREAGTPEGAGVPDGPFPWHSIRGLMLCPIWQRV